jgi:hypothetical protein
LQKPDPHVHAALQFALVVQEAPQPKQTSGQGQEARTAPSQATAPTVPPCPGQVEPWLEQLTVVVLQELVVPEQLICWPEGQSRVTEQPLSVYWMLPTGEKMGFLRSG